MWAVARVVDLGGTVLVETVGDAALRLTLHESALKEPQRRYSHLGHYMPYPFYMLHPQSS